MISRRNFVRRSLQAAGASMILPSITSCNDSHTGYSGKILGANGALGHRLRSMKFDPPSQTIKCGTAIIGGGIAGLSAARYLKQHTDDFKLFEMGSDVGGNAFGGSNTTSSYPWGAHYLPIPNDNDPELLSFLREANVITGYQNDLPVYNEYHLCFDPKERLYINNFWQDGLIPEAGVPAKDREEINRFTQLMHYYKTLKGSDGNDAFTIPVDFSSQDPTILSLDSMSMAAFLKKNNFSSEYLSWYVNYCCADDFGASMDDTSAWAGIHYFASRKGKAANAPSDTVLTWPEGNFFLVKALRKNLENNIISNALIFEVESHADHVSVLYFDATKNETTRVLATTAVLATPQFINHRIVKTRNQSFDGNAFTYAPWMVANITTDAHFTERHGELLSWDNVIYGSNALGYVHANHQDVSIQGTETVITYYAPLTGPDTQQQRRSAYEKKYEDWMAMIVDDLRAPHPAFEKNIKHADVWIWGHGMIRPSPTFMWGDSRRAALAPIGSNIFKAHSDMSGISIFEEAFYRGHVAAKQCLQRS